MAFGIRRNERRSPCSRKTYFGHIHFIPSRHVEACLELVKTEVYEKEKAKRDKKEKK